MKVNHFSTKAARSLRRGMTLLEIVIVLGIIGLIMAAGIGTFGGVLSGAKTRSAEMKMQGLTTTLESYKLLAGSYPSTSQGLDALVNKPSSSPQPKRWSQQIQSVPLDPWDNAYVYKYPGSKMKHTPEIISAGEDGQIGTDDDISTQDEM